MTAATPDGDRARADGPPAPADPSGAGEPWLARGAIRYVPVLHGPFELGLAVRAAFFARRPDAVAIELPSTVAEHVTRAVERLPSLSVVLYPEKDGTYVYLPIEPQDAIVEAARLALEHKVPLHCIDRDVEGYGRHDDLLPDPHAIAHLGYRAYVEPLVEGFRARPPDGADDARERAMAARLQALSAEHEDVLCVLGVAHAGRVMDLVAGPALGVPFGPRRRENARAANLAESSSREILSDTAYVAAAWELARGTPLPPEERVVELAPGASPGARPATEPGGTGPRKSPAPAPAPAPAGAPAPPSLAGSPLLAEAPPVKAIAAHPPRRIEELDRNRLNLDLVHAARSRYLASGVGRLTPAELRNLFRFARNMSLLKNALLPRLYELVIGARSVADDNFAYEVWDVGTRYPWQDADPGLSTVELKAEHLYLDGKLLRFRRKMAGLRRLPVPVRSRPAWKPAEWKEDWRGFSVCSYPPEDVVVEGYGAYLRKKAVAALAEEGARTEPFTSSLLDGIDLRETVRNWDDRKRLYVHESRPVRGKVGSVVVIFDPDEPAPGTAGTATGAPERYPWKLTWLGEHAQESDMALYATEPGQVLVGPGISRCEYGGFMMTFPPRRVYDVWEDPFFRSVTSKAERLLFAGLVYALEKMVVYVAARPPRPAWKALATRLDKKIVYLPIGQFSPPMLRRIRVFHVLDGYHVRAHAKEFVR